MDKKTPVQAFTSISEHLDDDDWDMIMKEAMKRARAKVDVNGKVSDKGVSAPGKQSYLLRKLH